MTNNDLKDMATQVRRDVLRMTTAAGSGHPGGSLSSADILTALFFKIMQHSPEQWDERRGTIGQDVFVLSAGHLAPALYSVLARTGYFPKEELSTLRKFRSRLQGHPSTEHGLPGIVCPAGSLGQGISVAAGIAIAKKAAGDNHKVYVLCGDGEFQEGQIWESLMFAANHKLDNLVVLVDCNNQQIDGEVRKVGGMTMIDYSEAAYAFGCATAVCDGDIIEDICSATSNHKSLGTCVVIFCETTMGKGVDFMEQAGCAYHGKTLSREQLKQALEQLTSTQEDY